MSYTSKENKLFAEICDGYGFEEIEQEAEGIYCDGCCDVHKRPTKMYKRLGPGGKAIEKLCKHQLIYLYEGGIELNE